MQPWFIATERFDSSYGEKWTKYVEWSGLSQLEEVVSLDTMLCPTILPETKDEYWDHIVNADFLLKYFTDLDFLREQLSRARGFNLLQVFHNPPKPPDQRNLGAFQLLGYDLVELETSTSAISNCGGFPLAFDNRELNSQGLVASFDRAVEIQASLKEHYPTEHHADCDVWAICRAIAL